MPTIKSMATGSGRNAKSRTTSKDPIPPRPSPLAVTTAVSSKDTKKKKQQFTTQAVAVEAGKKRRKVASSLSSSSSSHITTQEEDAESERTISFDPVSHHTFHPESKMKIHTLLLGTHPSIKSLSQSQYFGHPMNTFWWIAGDALGFRRGTGISPSSRKPYQFTKDLFYTDEHIISYDDQLKKLTSHGFAMWDILQSCKRKGSLDVDIKEERPNNIREYCADHPSIRRIVLCNGSSSVVFFNRHFKDWWKSGQLKPGPNVGSVRAFQKFEKISKDQFTSATIEVVCGIGVSPAAASYSYREKRNFYMEYCYEPGLKLLEELKDDHVK